jgi:hypothetical protein
MWLFELGVEFYDWLWRSKTYSTCQKCRNLFKFAFYAMLSAIIMLLLDNVDSEDFTETGYLIYASLYYIALVDIILYLIRLVNLCRGYREHNSILLAHTLIHLGYIANTVYVYYIWSTPKWEYMYTKQNIDEFWVTNILVWIRIIIYVFVVVIDIVFLPCILTDILRKRREKIRVLNEIRMIRARYAYPMAEEENNLHQPLLRNYEQYNVAIQPVHQGDMLPYDPVAPVIRENRNSFNGRLVNIINGGELEPINRRTIELLNRVSYASEKHRLTYDDCSI